MAIVDKILSDKVQMGDIKSCFHFVDDDRFVGVTKVVFAQIFKAETS